MKKYRLEEDSDGAQRNFKICVKAFARLSVLFDKFAGGKLSVYDRVFSHDVSSLLSFDYGLEETMVLISSYAKMRFISRVGWLILLERSSVTLIPA